jgi:hypothetical protein
MCNPVRTCASSAATALACSSRTPPAALSAAASASNSRVAASFARWSARASACCVWVCVRSGPLKNTDKDRGVQKQEGWDTDTEKNIPKISQTTTWPGLWKWNDEYEMSTLVWCHSSDPGPYLRLDQLALGGRALIVQCGHLCARKKEKIIK